MFRITPVYGNRWSTKGQATEPQCILIEYANARLLCNVGWWVFSSSDFPQLPEHNALLLTDSTTQCVGGLPLYHLQFPDSPVYATFPTVKMGQMTLYDQHAALTFDGKRPPFSLEEIDRAFGSVTCIKYSQSIRVRDLSITAHRSGHVVGGAFFHLYGIQDETSVVFTSIYHIAREIHLDSSTLLEHASTADVLVVSLYRVFALLLTLDNTCTCCSRSGTFRQTYPGGPAFRCLRRPSVKSRAHLPPLLVTQAERNLTDTVLSVLRREGNVLLPVDAAGRVLELALLLDRAWERQRLTQTYNLVWVAPMVANTAAFAKCQLEWMARQLTEQFDSTSGNPFQLKNMHLCSSAREFEQFVEEKQNPTCVLASGLCLEGGPARDILLMWASNPDHAVIFTDSSQCYLRRQGSSDDGTDASPSPAANAEPESVVEKRISIQRKTDGLATANTSVSEWTTAAQLLSSWFQAKVDEREMEDSVRVDVNVPMRSPLFGTELVEFLAREDEKRRELARNEEQVAMLREVEIAKGQLRLEEKDVVGVATYSAERTSENTSSTAGASKTKRKKRFDSLLFLKYSKPQFCT
jgi:cleavage and polyadenylation specificity factor subunit 2